MASDSAVTAAVVAFATHQGTLRDKIRVALEAAEPSWQPIKTQPADHSDIWLSDGRIVWFGTAWSDGSLNSISITKAKFWMPANRPAVPK